MDTLTASDLKVGDPVYHINSRVTGKVKALKPLVATITLDEPFCMSDKSNVLIDSQICLIENLRKL